MALPTQALVDKIEWRKLWRMSGMLATTPYTDDMCTMLDDIERIDPTYNLFTHAVDYRRSFAEYIPRKSRFVPSDLS